MPLIILLDLGKAGTPFYTPISSGGRGSPSFAKCDLIESHPSPDLREQMIERWGRCEVKGRRSVDPARSVGATFAGEDTSG